MGRERKRVCVDMSSSILTGRRRFGCTTFETGDGGQRAIYENDLKKEKTGQKEDIYCSSSSKSLLFVMISLSINAAVPVGPTDRQRTRNKPPLLLLLLKWTKEGGRKTYIG